MLYDIEGEDDPYTIISKCKCPTINIQLEGICVQALLDSGREISCISDKFYNDNLSVFRKLHCLPVLGLAVRCTTGSRTVNIKNKFLCRLFFNGYQVNLMFLVIPNLNIKCIIGYDIMKSLKIILDSDSNSKIFRDEKAPINIYSLSTQWGCDLNKITIKEQVREAHELNDFSCIFVGNSESYNAKSFNSIAMQNQINDFDITVEEIQQKVTEARGLSATHSEQLKNILYEYRQVFNKRTGLHNEFKYSLKLK